MADKMVWVDLETTGLDPREDEILEIGIKITDYSLNVIDSVQLIFNPWEENVIQAIDSLDPFIIDMHTKSGLWDDIKDPHVLKYNVWDSDAHACIKNFLESYEAINLPMCGNNVSFDRSFLAQHLPKVVELFHYRNIDVSSVKELYKIERERVMPINDWEYPEWISPTEGNHRALADIDTSISELKFYREHLFR